MSKRPVIFSGTANPGLAGEIAAELGLPLGVCDVEQFPDGEVNVRLDEPVFNRDVFIVQPTAPPVNDRLVELLAMTDACRRSSARAITAVVPYFGYARGDKRQNRRCPVMARVAADMLEAVGVDRVITLDPHTAQLEGFFRIPVDTPTALFALCKAVRGELPPETIVVSPDAGRVRVATEFASQLGTTVAILHKQRESGSETRVTHLVGDVRDRPCLVIDDMISTGGTIAESVEALLEAGARPEIYVAVTHGLFVGNAREILSVDGLRRIYATDTVAESTEGWPLLRRVPVASVLAPLIRKRAEW